MLRLHLDTQRARGLAVFSLIVLTCGLLSASCEPESENCVPKHPMFAGPFCASQLCVPVEQPETVVSDASDSTASLTCFGCGQPGPVQYRLEIAVGALGTGDWFYQPNTRGTLQLREQWDRSFTISALNAALQDSSVIIRNLGKTSSGQPLRMASYHVGGGDVLKASLSGGRVQLTLRGHLSGAAVADPFASPDCSSFVAGCVCGYGGSNVPVGSEIQLIEVDLPYRVHQP